MELNWSTFVLEIVNFLVLVWLIHRFLYRPVRQTVDRRRKAIEERLAEADRLHQEAEEMQARYENRLAEWEQEKQKHYESLGRELTSERQRRLEALEKEIAAEHAKARKLWEQEKREQHHHLERAALNLGASFTAKLLERLADRHLQDRLLELLKEDLESWSGDRIESLRRGWRNNPVPVTVTSAFPLEETRRRTIHTLLKQLLDEAPEATFAVDTDLLAGVHVDLGAYILRANLRDELKFFAHGEESSVGDERFH
ncbi:F0F1 ATP synthase subunit delta [Methylohalobius crimeensis]|uniref:F0F1 ATP synthase subunit delta n=1 Tax=Methylohalobius crimeensis TaxID=244365 RepID=UPI0003B3BFF1|nr:F0F1 ATP synthase subunit delta [Methylohalobius crimeensis]